MMDLISCDKCGVVLDKRKIEFPKEIETDDGSIDLTKAAWSGYDYYPFVKCPACGEPILDRESDD